MDEYLARAKANGVPGWDEVMGDGMFDKEDDTMMRDQTDYSRNLPPEVLAAYRVKHPNASPAAVAEHFGQTERHIAWRMKTDPTPDYRPARGAPGSDEGGS